MYHRKSPVRGLRYIERVHFKTMLEIILKQSLLWATVMLTTRGVTCPFLPT